MSETITDPKYHFWEREKPETIEAYGLIWRFYPKAGKLQVTSKKTLKNPDGELYDKFRNITIDRRAVLP